jgi:ribonuclease Y
MFTTQVLVSLIVCLAAGAGLGFLIYKIYRNQILKWAQADAQEILQEAKDLLEIRALEEKEAFQEIETELWTKAEPEMLKTEERIEELQELAEEKKQKIDQMYGTEKRNLQERENQVKHEEQVLKKVEQGYQSKKQSFQDINKQFVEKLSQQSKVTVDEAKTVLVQRLEEEANKRALKLITDTEENYKEHSESLAKRVLDSVLSRFARPYCPERGIGAVDIPDENARKRLCDPKGENIKAVQEACGCDIVVEDNLNIVGVAGFDPVRRELTRRTLERLFKEKKPYNPDAIKRIAENQKRELFKQIKHDGDAVAKELRLEGLHPEVRQMMGSLRYRYSFTQNQYFHCAEVGWLCGLLAGELNLHVKKARRSGLLHDIGKSMDHAIDGGHAVIGADFIEARGEAPDIVHNVRAHHHDVTPATDMAYLVIAADAISGGRPGARRSTLESYNQKVSELQDIARSFEGVTDCYVLNGGREIRAIVNGKKIDDIKALELSGKMAAKIEEECNYPGQIKVVVVRETIITESTLKQHA